MEKNNSWGDRFTDHQSEVSAYKASGKLNAIKALTLHRRLKLIGRPPEDMEDFEDWDKSYTTLLANLNRVASGGEWEE